MLEKFKAQFRKTSEYARMMREGGLSDDLIFFMENDGFRFKSTASAFEEFKADQEHSLRKKFETLFKKSQEFRKLMELCWGCPENVFKIDPKTEDYAISSVQAAWECFKAGAQ